MLLIHVGDHHMPLEQEALDEIVSGENGDMK